MKNSCVFFRFHLDPFSHFLCIFVRRSPPQCLILTRARGGSRYNGIRIRHAESSMLRVEHIKKYYKHRTLQFDCNRWRCVAHVVGPFFAYLSSLFGSLLLLCVALENADELSSVENGSYVMEILKEKKTLTQSVSNGRVFCAKIFYFSFIHFFTTCRSFYDRFELSNHVERKSEAFSDVTWRINNVAAMTT